MTVPTVESDVLSSVASALTVTVSVSAPTFSTTSTLRTSPMLSAIDVWTKRWNPSSSTLTS